MNFEDTKKSVRLVLATGEVPLIVGDSGIGKTALARELARENEWVLVVIDGNLLKEGEIGGLPMVEDYQVPYGEGAGSVKKTTVYAVHHKLRKIDEGLAAGREVLLFIDEINRCEHAVQQELMNLILNREINGYQLGDQVKILAAMNPSSKYGADFDYQVVDMDAAQENRFVWLNMEPDHVQWLGWAIDRELDQKVIEFISTFPDYLYKIHDEGIRATPRSYERISKTLEVYRKEQDSISRNILLHVLEGNVGKAISREFLHFMESDYSPLVSYGDVFSGEELSAQVIERVEKESHTRLYICAKNILKHLEVNILKNLHEAGDYVTRLIEFLRIYPVDLRVGIMKEIRHSHEKLYAHAIEQEAFVDLYFETHDATRG